MSLPRPSRRTVRWTAFGLLGIAVLVGAWLAVRRVEQPARNMTYPRQTSRTPIDSSRILPLNAAVAHAPDTTAPVAAAVPDTAVTRESPRALSPVHPVRVQVLNGCGVKGLAKLVSPGLRRMGFDVRETGNAAHYRYAQTRIIDRGGESMGRIVADSLGLDASRLTVEPARDLVDIDVTLIVGADYNLLPITAKRSERE